MHFFWAAKLQVDIRGRFVSFVYRTDQIHRPYCDAGIVLSAPLLSIK